MTTFHTEITHQRYRSGHLEIHRAYAGAALESEVFTLKSLGECLGLGAAAINAVYQRRALESVVVFSSARGGRPMRAFPLALLDTITEVIETPGARIAPKPAVNAVNTQSPDPAPAQNPVEPGCPLEMEDCPDGRFITAASIARQLGRSETAVRAQLQRANMMAVSVSTGSNAAGGRPRRGWTAEHADELLRVFTRSHRRVDRPTPLMAADAPDHATPQPASPMAEILAEHARNDAKRRAAGVPVGDTFDTKALAADIAAEIEKILATAPAPTSPDQYAVPTRPERPTYRFMLQHYPRPRMDDYWCERLAVEMNTYPDGSHPYIDTHKPPRPEHFDRAKAEIFRWATAKAKKDPSFEAATLEDLESRRAQVMENWWNHWTEHLAPGCKMMRVDLGAPAKEKAVLTEDDHIANARALVTARATLADVDDLCSQLALAGVTGARIAQFRSEAREAVQSRGG